MYTYIHTFTYADTEVRARVHPGTCTQGCILTHAHTFIHMCKYAGTRAYFHTCTNSCLSYIHPHRNTHINKKHAQIHTCTHTLIQKYGDGHTCTKTHIYCTPLDMARNHTPLHTCICQTRPQGTLAGTRPRLLHTPVRPAGPSPPPFMSPWTVANRLDQGQGRGLGLRRRRRQPGRRGREAAG